MLDDKEGKRKNECMPTEGMVDERPAKEETPPAMLPEDMY